MESLSTILTWIWPSIRVDEQMCGQSGTSLERFATLFAGECPFAVVNCSEKKDIERNETLLLFSSI